jgi:hypothetical protein
MTVPSTTITHHSNTLSFDIKEIIQLFHRQIVSIEHIHTTVYTLLLESVQHNYESVDQAWLSIRARLDNTSRPATPTPIQSPHDSQHHNSTLSLLRQIVGIEHTVYTLSFLKATKRGCP